MHGEYVWMRWGGRYKDGRDWVGLLGLVGGGGVGTVPYYLLPTAYYPAVYYPSIGTLEHPCSSTPTSSHGCFNIAALRYLRCSPGCILTFFRPRQPVSQSVSQPTKTRRAVLGSLLKLLCFTLPCLAGVSTHDWMDYLPTYLPTYPPP
jgi:hypothetical protein